MHIVRRKLYTERDKKSADEIASDSTSALASLAIINRGTSLGNIGINFYNSDILGQDVKFDEIANRKILDKLESDFKNSGGILLNRNNKDDLKIQNLIDRNLIKDSNPRNSNLWSHPDAYVIKDEKRHKELSKILNSNSKEELIKNIENSKMFKSAFSSGREINSEKVDKYYKLLEEVRGSKEGNSKLKKVINYLDSPAKEMRPGIIYQDIGSSVPGTLSHELGHNYYYTTKKNGVGKIAHKLYPYHKYARNLGVLTSTLTGLKSGYNKEENESGLNKYAGTVITGASQIPVLTSELLASKKGNQILEQAIESTGKIVKGKNIKGGKVPYGLSAASYLLGAVGAVTASQGSHYAGKLLGNKIRNWRDSTSNKKEEK